MRRLLGLLYSKYYQCTEPPAVCIPGIPPLRICQYVPPLAEKYNTPVNVCPQKNFLLGEPILAGSKLNMTCHKHDTKSNLHCVCLGLACKSITAPGLPENTV